jgi:hypothetical protein
LRKKILFEILFSPYNEATEGRIIIWEDNIIFQFFSCCGPVQK